MKALTTSAFLDLLSNIRGATFATLVTSTDPKLLKTGNPFKNVRKISKVNVCLGFKYEAAVNRQRAREGSEADFQASARQWGEKNGIIVENKGKQYLEVKVEKSLSSEYVDAEGNLIPKESIQHFLPTKRESRQELEKEIIVRTYSLDSIQGMTFNGETYVILRDLADKLK